MANISVPLSAELLRQLESFLRQGKSLSKAAVVRTALEKYLEDQAVEDILRAQNEPRLEGDLRTLVKKLRRKR